MVEARRWHYYTGYCIHKGNSPHVNSTRLGFKKKSVYSLSLIMVNQKKTSVWKHFDEIHEGNKIIAKCRYCDQKYVNNATRMKRHLCTCKKCPDKIQCIFQKLVQHKTGVTTASERNLLQKPHVSKQIFV